MQKVGMRLLGLACLLSGRRWALNSGQLGTQGDFVLGCGVSLQGLLCASALGQPTACVLAKPSSPLLPVGALGPGTDP